MAHLRLRRGLREDLEPETGGEMREPRVSVVREDGEHQEHGVRARGVGREDLALRHDEVLRKEGFRGEDAELGEPLKAPAEVLRLREDRDGVGEAPVDAGVLGGVDFGAHQPPRGRGGLHFENHAAAGPCERRFEDARTSLRLDADPGEALRARAAGRVERRVGDDGERRRALKGMGDDGREHRAVDRLDVEFGAAPQGGGERGGRGTLEGAGGHYAALRASAA